MGDTPRHPNLSARQQAILDHARHHGDVQVELLADTFQVTPQTIRRDLNQLCQMRLLQRVHGGAVIADGVENLGYAARKLLAAEMKEAIGRRAAMLIPNDSSLIINIGTTTEQVAEHLIGHVGLLVITNNINVVNTLRNSDTIEVMTAGGLVRREDGGIVGEATTDFIRQFKVDYAVIGASAIEEDGTILDFDMREVRVAQTIIRNARSVILVADEMKFHRKAPIRIGSIADIDYFVTDKRPPGAFLEVCAAHGVEVIMTHDKKPHS
ncbi:MAG: DeoR/GlpR family DNA-binding transcription regulator [Gammaproteobacteria bacterium]